MNNTKEIVLEWLRTCSSEGDGEHCVECPYAGFQDCSGALMKDAAAVLEGVSCGEGGGENDC